MDIAMAVSLIVIAGVCLIAYLSLWYAINDIKDSLEYIKRFCNNESEIKQSEHILRELISKSHKELLTEIACLATKNNEDIKRINDGWQEGDVIKSKDKDVTYVVVKRLYSDGILGGYMLFGNDYNIRHVSYEVVKDASFIKHVTPLSSSFDD